jgi:hypothetical protein
VRLPGLGPGLGARALRRLSPCGTGPGSSEVMNGEFCYSAETTGYLVRMSSDIRSATDRRPAQMGEVRTEPRRSRLHGRRSARRARRRFGGPRPEGPEFRPSPRSPGRTSAAPDSSRCRLGRCGTGRAEKGSALERRSSVPTEVPRSRLEARPRGRPPAQVALRSQGRGRAEPRSEVVEPCRRTTR